MNHLRLAFGSEGGGGSERCDHLREVVWWQSHQNNDSNHLWHAFGHKGGGSGGSLGIIGVSGR